MNYPARKNTNIQDDHDRMGIDNFLIDCFEKSYTITGIASLLHTCKIQTKPFSFSLTSKEEKVCTNREQLSLGDISGYVIFTVSGG